MRSKIIAAALAGGLVVGAGLATSLVSSPSVAQAQEASDETGPGGLLARGLSFLSGVLSDLVGEGTIDQGQADAILAATEEKAAELKAERQALMELTKSLLEDGVITEDEATQLPDDHPFFGKQYDEAWSDGELTVEEIRAIRPHPRRNAFKNGARFGALLDDGGIDQAEYDALIQGLPTDHPLAQIDVSEYLADGVITVDELREIFASNDTFGRGWFGGDHPFGPDTGATDNDAPAA